MAAKGFQKDPLTSKVIGSGVPVCPMVTQPDIRDDIPEIDLIESESLKDKVVEAWEMALEEGEYDTLREVPGLPMNGVSIDNLRHTRGVTNLAISMVEAIAQSDGISLNTDHVLAGAICHDLGKVFEYVDLNGGKWINGTWEHSKPTIRHSVYGASIAWSLGFPREVVHIIASHSLEGEHVISSQEACVVSMADSLYWELAIPGETGYSKEELLYQS